MLFVFPYFSPVSLSLFFIFTQFLFRVGFFLVAFMALTLIKVAIKFGGVREPLLDGGKTSCIIMDFLTWFFHVSAAPAAP